MLNRDRQILFDRLVHTVFAFVLGYSIVYFVMGARLSSILLFISASIFTPLTFLLDRKGFSRSARLLFIVNSLYCISSSILGIPSPVDVEFYFIPAMMLPFILFDPNQRIEISIGMTLPLVAWAIAKWAPKPHLGTYWQPEIFPFELFKVLNFVGAMAITALFLIHYANKQKASHLKIKENSDLMSKILEALPVAVFAKDVQKNFTGAIWNKRATEIFGIKEEEYLGKSDEEFFLKEQADFFRKKDIEATQSHGVIEIPVEDAQTKNGVVKLYTRKVVIRDTKGNPKLLVGISEDITPKVAAEQLIHDQQAKMITSAKMSSLGEMASGIAHEINNPLAIIYGKAWQLKKLHADGKLGHEQISEGLDQIEKTADRIAKIIRGLRSFSRNSEADPMQPFKVSSLIEETLELCRERFRSKGITISTELLSDPLTEGRATQIGQILSNLLLNSYDAIENLPDKWVKIKVEEADAKLKISVTDSGSGIAPEVAEKIMQPFFTTKEVGKGTGLGLSISLGIAQEHKGRLIYNPKCANTQFVLELPLLQNGQNVSV